VRERSGTVSAHGRPHGRRFPRLLPACILLGSLVLTPAAHADVRVGYIDSSRIWIEFKDAKEAQDRFERQVQGWRDEAAEKERTVNQLRSEVRDQSPVLSALKRQEKESALTKAISDYEGFVQEVWGPNGRAAQENTRATDEIIQLVRRSVEKIAAQKGLELVLDATGGFIIYADKSLDMTNDVIADLNVADTGSAH
jgi:outer membrane protein